MCVSRRHGHVRHELTSDDQQQLLAGDLTRSSRLSERNAMCGRLDVQHEYSSVRVSAVQSCRCAEFNGTHVSNGLDGCILVITDEGNNISK